MGLAQRTPCHSSTSAGVPGAFLFGVTYGRDYDGKRVSATPWRDNMEQPELFWVPSVTASGITFYSGSKIPAWKGNLFVGAIVGRIGGTGNLQRCV